MLRVLGVIPARGGSKGIPRKNIANLAGRPLLYYTISAAQGSRFLTRTLLSSEDDEINAVGRALGVEVAFIRPPDLATDKATSQSVANHALTFAEKEENTPYDAVCLLQPTCPLRESVDIDNTIGVLAASDADSVVSMTQVEEPHPYKMMVVNGGVATPLFPDHWRETLRRQELAPTFFLNGAIYLVRRDVLLERDSLWGRKTLAYVMPADRSVNIDRPDDLTLAEVVLSKRRHDS